MTVTALLLAALIAGPEPHDTDATAQPVLAEMAPAPGRWEVEDAPAYFSDRQAITDARAAGAPVAQGDQARRAGTREGASLVARRP